jgi:hypothetical protein
LCYSRTGVQVEPPSDVPKIKPVLKRAKPSRSSAKDTLATSCPTVPKAAGKPLSFTKIRPPSVVLKNPGLTAVIPGWKNAVEADTGHS